MNYIVLDLEWNQGTEGVERGPAFEIVEIGAVKLNEQMEQIGQFHRLIRPQIYHEMHKVTGELIQLDMEELQDGESFPEVVGRFLSWCGGEQVQADDARMHDGTQMQTDERAGSVCEQFMFCTWGTQDLTELQRNMRYYGMEPLSGGPIPYLDVQKLFSIAYEDRKTRRTLEYAVDYLHIAKDAPFHRAFEDAYYTGKVLAQCKDPTVLRNVSYDVYHPPVRREEEIKVQFDTYCKYISRQFADREEAFRDREVMSSKCYICHCNIRKKIKWFSGNGKQYYCLAYCEKHGYLKGKIRVRKTDDDMVYVVKTTKFITEEQAGEIERRREHVSQMRKKHRSGR